MWSEEDPQAIKDRWIFSVRPDGMRESICQVDDASAVRYWVAHHEQHEERWALGHPELKEALTA